MASAVLPFEAPVVHLLERVRELRKLAETDPSVAAELAALEASTCQVARELFNQLTPMQKVQLSRHPQRPYTLDYIQHLFTDWVELHGDRRFADDRSIVAGLASFQGRSVVVVGHQKGRSTKENMIRNFGMPHPEGYRKAIRLYEMADRFRLPLLTFIDTPGAYPGIGAEERGQSEAIGACLAALSNVGSPVIATIIGEGGSGGALALGLANRVLMLEFGCYSVISPEGCAAILWKDGSRSAEAAERLRITAPDLLAFGIVDEVIEEPPGGAHQDHVWMARRLGDALQAHLGELLPLSPQALRDDRYRKFRAMGVFAS
ncbi:MAG: acetyl-CoA carboxylase carboxyltransferase subunit alpha [Myxococcales bacterium]|nr:acetyl-CoA carboxylase carboxyltransferase subunit alpha [Polyangiaceae bacterium]MDW8250006.1 acetyl-CoA carboxylase carboxyltransferase subunit alpha [Myxococcales bacterium]